MPRVASLLLVPAFTLFAAQSRADAWVSAGTTAQRDRAAAFSPSTKTAVVYGGSTANAELYDESTNTWVPHPTPYPYASRQAVPIGSGKFVIAAGNVGQIYDGTWMPSLDLVSAGGARGGHVLVKLADGRVLATGGRDYTMSPEVTNKCRIFDPTTGAWSDAAPMNDMRNEHAGILLNDHRVLVIGGYDNSGAILSSAEVYDPSTDKWTVLPATSLGRQNILLATMTDGTVAVIGGALNNPATNLELFDPKTNTFAIGVKFLVPRSQSVGAWSGNRFMIIGGSDDGGAAISDVELLDANTKTTNAGVPLITARARSFAVALGSGTIVVGGGATRIDGSAMSITTAEKFVTGIAPDAGADASDAATDTSVTDTGATDSGSAPDTAMDTGMVDATAPRPPGDKPVLSGVAARCLSASECSSGFCVEGVCCNSACTDKCHSCVLPTSPGICALEPAGIDLKAECAAPNSCLWTCSGSGTCVNAGPGTMCARSHCDGASHGVAAAYCSAAGAACDESAMVGFECSPFACDQAFGACLSQCTHSDQCAAGFVCDNNTCVAPPASDEGGCVTSSSRTHAGGGAFLLALAALSFLRRRVTSSR